MGGGGKLALKKNKRNRTAGLEIFLLKNPNCKFFSIKYLDVAMV